MALAALSVARDFQALPGRPAVSLFLRNQDTLRPDFSTAVWIPDLGPVLVETVTDLPCLLAYLGPNQKAGCAEIVRGTTAAPQTRIAKHSTLDRKHENLNPKPLHPRTVNPEP